MPPSAMPLNPGHGPHTLPCASCGEPGAATAGQTVFQGWLRWHRSTRCARCGCVTEEDGLEFPPPDLRAHLLRRHGTWRLEVDTPDRLAAVKTVRALRGLPLSETATILRGEAPVHEGTKAEAEWILQTLQATGSAKSARVSLHSPPEP